jgi:hypothetical protein
MLDVKWHGRSDIDSLDLDITPHLEVVLSSVQLPSITDLTNQEAAVSSLRTFESCEAKLKWVRRICSSLQATMQSSHFLQTTR